MGRSCKFNVRNARFLASFQPFFSAILKHILSFPAGGLLSIYIPSNMHIYSHAYFQHSNWIIRCDIFKHFFLSGWKISTMRTHLRKILCEEERKKKSAAAHGRKNSFYVFAKVTQCYSSFYLIFILLLLSQFCMYFLCLRCMSFLYGWKFISGK